MNFRFLLAITNLGDSAFTSAIAFSLIAYLLFLKQKRAALAVGIAYAATAGVIVAGKILLYIRCDKDALPLALASPSGHTAMSVAVYGIFAVLVSASLTDKKRVLPYLVAVPLVLLIALSRLLLHYHTVGDILAGFATGAAVCAAAGWPYLRGEPLRCGWRAYFLIVAILVIALHGLHFPAESFINRAARAIQGRILSC